MPDAPGPVQPLTTGAPAWLALLGEPAPGSVPVITPDGEPAGHLLLRRGPAKPVRDAVRIDAGLLGAGPPLAVSLVLPPRGSRPLFDDPAVVRAMQDVLRDPGRAPVLSSLVDGSTRWAGALSGVAAEHAAARPAWWRDDPFARLGPQHRLLVAAGALVAAALPVGPGHQRHAGAPWPWGRFSTVRPEV